MIIEVQYRDHVQRMTYEEFERRIREGGVSADTPVRFEVVTGDAFMPAGDLELYQTLADPGQLAFRQNLSRPGVPIVTALLVGFQVRVYLWAMAPGAESWLKEHFTVWAPAVLEHGEVWRLLSYGLLHVNFSHILFNLLFLAYTAYHLERALGRANLLVLYFGSVFVGGLLSMAMSPDRPSLGASGGDFGLLAAVVIFGWKYWDSIPERSRKYYGYALLPYLVFSIFAGLRSETVDNWSHFGGLMAGAVLMTLLEPEVLVERVPRNRKVRWVVVALMGLLGTGVALAGPRLVHTAPYEDGAWTVDRPGYWREGWTFTGDRGWFAPTGGATVVVATTVHPRPVSAEEAAQALVQRIGAGGRNTQVVSSEDLVIEGWKARRLVVEFEMAGEAQRVVALVVVRGLYEHRLQFQVLQEQADRYEPLVQRLLDSIDIHESEEVLSARRKARAHPRSWAPATELGDALYRAGQPDEALRAYERALSLSPVQTGALVGRLRTYADYSLPGGTDVARRTLDTAPLDPDVVVAVADALSAAGEEAEAGQVLEDAWEALPGDRVLRRARLGRGLSVALEPTSDADGALPITDAEGR